MRLTPTTAATAAAVGFALLAAGCSSSKPAAGPVVRHVTPVQSAADQKAKPLTPRQALAKAQRMSVAAHSVMFRQRTSVRYFKSEAPAKGRSQNPLEAFAGTANFHRNWMLYHYLPGTNASQPEPPAFTVLRKGQALFGGRSESLRSGHAWTQAAASDSLKAKDLVDVLSGSAGKVRLVARHASLRDGAVDLTKYSVRVDVGRSILDNGAPGSRALGRQLLGHLATEFVWVDHAGEIAQVRMVYDTARVSVPGVDVSKVKAVVVTLRLTNYGLDMVVPPYRGDNNGKSAIS